MGERDLKEDKVKEWQTKREKNSVQVIRFNTSEVTKHNKEKQKAEEKEVQSGGKCIETGWCSLAVSRRTVASGKVSSAVGWVGEGARKCRFNL